MEVTHIILARSIFLFELASLNPVGRKTAAENNQQLQARYGFAGYPQSLSEITGDKGAEFLSGRMGNIAIDKVTLYHNGIVVDTRSSTEDSEKVAIDILEEAQRVLDSKVTVTRKQFVSQFVFRSEMKLEKLSPVL